MTRILCFCLVMLLGASGITAAEVSRSQRGGPTPPGTPAAGNPDPDTLSDGQVLAMLDAWAIVQAQQQLAIPDDKHAIFMARLKRVQDTRRRNQRDRRLIIQELRRLVGRNATEAPDENAVRTQLAALKAQDEKAAAENRKAYDALDEILTPQQQARFRLFEEVIEQRKLDLLTRAQEKRRLNKPAPR
jgi:Spy/CpxP family protein refolding chaperone